MSDVPSPDFDLELMMQRIRDEVARRKGTSGATITVQEASPGPALLANASEATASPHRLVLTRLHPSGEIIEPKRAYALEEFLRFHDEDFVANAYRGILQREPDAPGYGAFLEKLRTGTLSKIEILGRMRFSAEGRAVGVPISGLSAPFFMRSARRVPVAGRLIGIVQYLVRLPDVVRNHERLEAVLFHERLALKREINGVVGEIERNLQLMEERAADRARAAAAQIASVEREAADRDTDITRRVEGLRRDLAVTTEIATQVVPLRDDLTVTIDRTDMLERTTVPRSEMEGRLNAIEASVQARVDHQQLARLLEATNARLGGALEDAVGTLRDQVADSRRMVLDQQRRLRGLIDAAQARGGTDDAQERALIAEDDHLLDELYVAFEDRFRGSRADIRSRVEIYVPIVQESGAGTSDAPVVDLGCGRGEWLECLRDANLVARGVDGNRVMIDYCRERGLDVAQAEAVEHLRALESMSVGAITAIHVIEHVPFKDIVRLLDEALRVLRPGGVVIFETPNPANVFVGACTFYYDPSHVRPLPAEAMSFLAQARGFARVETRGLHPVPHPPVVADDSPAVLQRVMEAFYGPQDYCLIAFKATP